MENAFVVAPGEGRLIDLREFEMRVTADAQSAGGVVSVMKATEPPGSSSRKAFRAGSASAGCRAGSSTSTSRPQ
jgi:hypothetical protein